MRPDLPPDRPELLEHRLVDVQAPRRVEDERREPARGRLLTRLPADRERRLPGGADDGDPELGAERPELVLRRRPLRVRGGEQRVLALLSVQTRQLRSRRGLARALEADEHDHRRRVRGRGEPVAAAAEQLDQLAVDDLHHLLGRRERREHVPADRLGPDALDEGPDDLEVDVRLEERHAHLAEGFLDVVLRQPAAAAELVEDGLQSRAQRFKHRKG